MTGGIQISIFDPPPKEQRLTQCMKIVKYMNLNLVVGLQQMNLLL